MIRTLFLLLAALFIAVPASAEDTRVYVGLYLHDVAQFEPNHGVFDIDAELWVKWSGELDPNQVVIANAGDLDRKELGVETDGDWNTARWRLRGTLRGVFPMQRYPWDQQTLPVIVELRAPHGELVPDLASSGMSQSFSLTDWNYEPHFRLAVSEDAYPSDLGALANEGSSTSVSRVAFEVVMERPLAPVFLKLFLPLLIIAVVAMIPLYVHPSMVTPRTGVGVTALLTSFAFNFSLADSLPAVSYMTLADSLFVVAYFLCFLCIATTIAVYGMSRGGREKAAGWVDLGMRIALPIVSIAAVLAVLPGPPPPAPVAHPDPVPSMARQASARDQIVVGATMLYGITGTPLSYGSRGSAVHDGEPWYVERVPGVNNDALTFRSDGSLVVRWRLREGLSWSDDRPVVADDILLPLEASPHPLMANLKALDERTIEVTWSDRVAIALEAPDVWPSHTLRPTFTDGGYDAVYQRLKHEALPAVGAYRVTGFEAKSHGAMTANPAFFGEAPAISDMEVRYFKSRDELVSAIERDEIDITFPNSLTLDQANDLAERRPDWVHVRPGPYFIFIQPDLADPDLAKLAVRKGILQSINRARVASEVYGEAGRVAHVPVPGDLPAGSLVTEHDPSAARRALAGLQGRSLKLLYSKSPIDSHIAGLIAEDLESVGIRVEHEIAGSTSKAARARDHGGLLLHVVRGRRDSEPKRYWNLRSIDGTYEDVRNDAFTDEIARLCERERKALYPERRDQLRDTLLAQTSHRLPNLPIVFAAERMVANPALQGWKTDAETNFGSTVEDWYLSPEPREGAPDE